MASKVGDWMGTIKSWVSSLTEILIGVLALSIVASLIFGANNMGLGDVVGNIITLVKQFGQAGLAGLISLGIFIAILSN